MFELREEKDCIEKNIRIVKEVQQTAGFYNSDGLNVSIQSGKRLLEAIAEAYKTALIYRDYGEDSEQ